MWNYLHLFRVRTVMNSNQPGLFNIRWLSGCWGVSSPTFLVWPVIVSGSDCKLTGCKVCTNTSLATAPRIRTGLFLHVSRLVSLSLAGHTSVAPTCTSVNSPAASWCAIDLSFLQTPRCSASACEWSLILPEELEGDVSSYQIGFCSGTHTAHSLRGEKLLRILLSSLSSLRCGSIPECSLTSDIAAAQWIFQRSGSFCRTTCGRVVVGADDGGVQSDL